MSDAFVGWLNSELELRGWSRSEAARRGGISSSAMDKVLNGHANPGVNFCRGIAAAFGLRLEDVYRLAGLLPPAPAAASDTGGEALLRRLRRLPAVDQEYVLRSWAAVLEFAESRPARAGGG
jgi:transcriptional regulator with XRE-family HTH domain